MKTLGEIKLENDINLAVIRYAARKMDDKQYQRFMDHDKGQFRKDLQKTWEREAKPSDPTNMARFIDWLYTH